MSYDATSSEAHRHRVEAVQIAKTTKAAIPGKKLVQTDGTNRPKLNSLYFVTEGTAPEHTHDAAEQISTEAGCGRTTDPCSTEVVALITAALQETLMMEADQAEIEEVLNLMVSLSLKEADTVVESAGPGGSFYVVVSGTLEAQVDNQVVETLEKGSHFGELSVFYKERSHGVIKALTDSEVTILLLFCRPLLSAHKLLWCNKSRYGEPPRPIRCGSSLRKICTRHP
jgi:hypothetical protein